MTVPAQDRFTFSSGNGVTTTFPYTFMIPGTVNNPQFLVYLIEIATGIRTDLTVDVDYSISGLGVEAGGVVTYPLSGAPLPATHRIVIESNMPYEQQTDVYNSGTLYLNAIEDQFDNTTRQVQQIQDRVNRTFSVGIGYAGNYELFPVPDRLIGWNSTGTALENKQSESESAAAAYAAQLAAEAAAAALPPIIANRMLVDNPAGTARETKTFAEVRTLLDIGLDVTAGSAVGNRSTETISPFDPEFGADGVGDDLTAIQSAWTAGSTRGVPIVMAHKMDAGGQLIVKQDMTVIGRAGAVLYQTGWSDVGGFIVAADPTPNDPATIKNNIHFRDPHISGLNNPKPTTFITGTGSTTTTIVLDTLDKAGNPVSTVDDFYNGRAIIVAEGAASNGVLRFVTDYVGATRTLTLTSALPAAPAAGDDVLMGWNDLGIGLGGGVSDITIMGGRITDYAPLDQVPPPSGAKGVNFEQGTTNALIWGTTFRNLGIAVFIQGLDGAYTTGAKKRTVGIRVGGYHAENVGSVLTVAGVNGTQLPDGDADDQMGLASFITYENAGHKPYRFVGSDQQKSGIIDIIEGQNFSISHVSGRNDTTYPNTSPGYPTDYPSRVGYGLSGDVGAMIWGHGRNISIDDFKHWGNVDCVWTIRRGRALGDDGQVTSGAGVTGRPGNVLGNRFTNIQLFGQCARVIEVDPTSTFRVLNEELTGELQCVVDGVTSSIVDPNMSGYTNIIIDVTRRSDGKRVRGTPAQIILAGNQFDLLPEKETILRGGRVYTLADDQAVRIVPPKKSGFMRWGVANGAGGASSNYGQVHYTIQGAATCTICFGPATLSVDTTVLTTGTTDGVDVNTNVNAVVSDGIYLKNRTGVTRTYEVFFD